MSYTAAYVPCTAVCGLADVCRTWLMVQGDIVEVLDRARDDWWLIKRGAVQGYAPAAYYLTCSEILSQSALLTILYPAI
eukprot:COSAG05_NODE_2515_length_2955_cov_2.717787_5_plen_79_part_00